MLFRVQGISHRGIIFGVRACGPCDVVVQCIGAVVVGAHDAVDLTYRRQALHNSTIRLARQTDCMGVPLARLAGDMQPHRIIAPAAACKVIIHAEGQGIGADFGVKFDFIRQRHAVLQLDFFLARDCGGFARLLGQQAVQGDIVVMLACISTAVRLVLRPCKGIVQLVAIVHLTRGSIAYRGGFQKREVEVIPANLLFSHVIPQIIGCKELQRGQVVIAEFAVRPAHDLDAVVPADGVIVTSNSFQGLICGDFPPGHDLRITGIDRHRDDLQVGVAAVKDRGGQVAQHKFRAAAVDRLFHRSKRHILAVQRLRVGCRCILCRIADLFITGVLTHQHNAVVRHGVGDCICGKLQGYGNRQVIRRAAGYDRLSYRRRTVDRAAVATIIPGSIVCLGNTDLLIIAGRLHPCTCCTCTRGCRGAQAGGRAKAVCYRCLGVACIQRNLCIGLVHQVGGYLPVTRVLVIACVCQHKILAVGLPVAVLLFQADLQLRGRQRAHEVLRGRLYLITYLGSVHGLYTDTELAAANGIRQRIIRVKQIARTVDLYVSVVRQSCLAIAVNLIQRYQIMAYILYLVIWENAICGRGRPCYFIAAIDSAAIVFMRNCQIGDLPGAALIQNLRIVVLDQVVRDVLHTRVFAVVLIAVPQQDGGNFFLL